MPENNKPQANIPQNGPQGTTLGYVDRNQNRVTLEQIQFSQLLRELRRAIIYGAVLQGFVNSKPGATPSKANMKTVSDLAEAALELME